MRAGLVAVLLLLAGCAGSGAVSSRAAVPATMPAFETESSGVVCRQLERGVGEPQAFFGMHVDTCIAPTGRVALMVTGYDIQDGRSPARAAGVRIGDEIEFVAGCRVLAADGFNQKRANATAGNPYAFQLRRGGHEVSVTVMTEPMPKIYRRSRAPDCGALGLRRLLRD